MKIQDFYASKFACFDHLEKADKEAQIQAVQYIERMSALLNIDLTHVGIFDVFGQAVVKDKLITEKGEINKRLTSIENNPTKQALTEAEENLIKELASVARERRREEITSLKDSIAYELNYAKQTQASVDLRLKRAYEQGRKLRQLENKSDMDLIEEFRKIAQGGFWEIARASRSDEVAFKTKSDVILTQVNPAAGQNIHINFGKYIARLLTTTAEIRLEQAEYGKPQWGSYFHPYASGIGQICWGNASETAHELIATGKFSEVFSLLAALLTNYSTDTTPYWSLEDFQREVDKRNGIKDEDDVERCSNCDEITDNCECYFCDQCEERTSDPCDEHWCSVCQSYDYGRCGCCSNCENPEGECQCCTAGCGSTDTSCGCCQDCSRSSSRLERDGHSQYCEHYKNPAEQPATQEESE